MTARGLKSKKLKSKKIGVLMGGLSEEREISLKTGTAVLKALRHKGYRAVGIDAGRDVAASLKRKKIEAVFIALHGRYGEDGCVQGMCEVMGIPYTGSGVMASAMAMNKPVAKRMFRLHGVSTPAYAVAHKAAARGLKYPLIVKPACQGSAIGVTVVRRKKDLAAAVREAERHGGAALIEEYVEGRELTVAILDGEALPVIEIRPKKGIYDYKAKYTKGMTEFIVPARLPGRTLRRVVAEALGAYNSLQCSGAARVDVMLSKEGAPHVLEVNTVPGLTGLSLFPRAAAAAGLDYASLVERMLKGAGLDKS